MKSRKSGSGYSPSTLFGQPFFVSAPVNTTEQDLYQLALDRMTRYVTRPEQGDEWWKPPKEEKTEEKMEVDGGTPSTPSSWSEESPNSELSLPTNNPQDA